MKQKACGCYSIDRAELLEVLRLGGQIRWWWNDGPMIYDPRDNSHSGRELHPRRDMVLRMIKNGLLVDTSETEANRVQRECGLSTFRLKELAVVEK